MTVFRALWLIIATSIRVGPGRSSLVLLEALGRVGVALIPYLLGLLTTGVLTKRNDLAVVALCCIAVITGTNFILQIVGIQARTRQRQEVAFAFDREVAETIARIPTVDHLEIPEHLDRMESIRANTDALSRAYNLLATAIVNTSFTLTAIGVAITADLRLAILVLFGAPSFLAVRLTAKWQRSAEAEGAPYARRFKQIFSSLALPQWAAESRIFRLEGQLRDQMSADFNAWSRPKAAADLRDRSVAAACTVLYFAAAAVIVGLMIRDAAAGRTSAASVAIGISSVAAMQSVIQTVSDTMRSMVACVRAGGELLWLRNYADGAIRSHAGGALPPDQLNSGIRLENVGFQYQDDSPALHDVSTHLRAGSIVALVGANGAGKSTLVKLLTGMHDPSGGQILIDGVDLRSMDLSAWRSRVSGAFQDHVNLELTAQYAVGLGDPPKRRDESAVARAADLGLATTVIEALPNRWRTQLGGSWPDGVDLSGGQWQRIAIARGMMRAHPLLLVLDEPTSALDATTEHELFERYISAAKQARNNTAVVLLVTHRFSTVRSADSIIVLQDGHIEEFGSHDDLMAAGGLYEQMYRMQAAGYQ